MRVNLSRKEDQSQSCQFFWDYVFYVYLRHVFFFVNVLLRECLSEKFIRTNLGSRLFTASIYGVIHLVRMYNSLSKGVRSVSFSENFEYVLKE